MVVTITETVTVPTSKVPTVDDIRRAAAQSVVADDSRVETVYVFGSVARGEATDESDVDVIVVVTDHITRDEHNQLDNVLGEHFECGTGCSVDLMSRRRSVFDHLVRNVPASVEHYVMSDAVCVYETDVRSTPTGNIDGVPRNYLELALNTADDISGGLSALARHVEGVSREEARMLPVDGSQANIDYAVATRAARYKSLLQDSHMVIEQALRATAAAVDSASLGKGHDLDELVPKMSETPEKQALEAVVDTLRDEDGKTKMWRLGPYIAHSSAWAKEITAENALKHVLAADACGRLVLSTLEKHAHNEPRVAAATVRLNRTLDILEPLARTADDLETGSRTTSRRSRWRQKRQEAKQRRKLRKEQRDSQKQRQQQQNVQKPAALPKIKAQRRPKRCGALTAKGKSCQHWVTGPECPAGHKRA